MKVNDYIAGTKPNLYAGETKKTAGEAGKRANSQDESESNALSGDRVQISDRSREIARAQELVQSAPEVRTEKIEAIKAKIAAGTYNVSGKDVADAMIRSIISETV